MALAAQLVRVDALVAPLDVGLLVLPVPGVDTDDIVVIDPWDWQDEKADIEWRYEGANADQLRREGHLNNLV